MKRKRLKPFVFPVFSAVVAVMLLIGILSIEKVTSDPEVSDNYVYSNNSIVNETKPVINEEESEVIIRPYKIDKIDIYKKFYNNQDDSDKGIILFNGTYMQSTGIVYNSEKEFDVLAVAEGDVIDVKKEDLMGYVIEIKHSNNLITVYTGLKSVNVKKGEKLSQNAVLGKSGELKLDVNLKNSLMFEIIKNGKYEDPELFFDKKINEI